VSLIDQNLAAQLKILDAVRTAYARAAPERRAFANAIQRRRTLISSLLDAFENFVVSNGGTPLETSSETVAASPTCGLLPDAVLAERCAKGLDFYQRLLTNVSKLLQRVKGMLFVRILSILHCLTTLTHFLHLLLWISLINCMFCFQQVRAKFRLNSEIR